MSKTVLQWLNELPEGEVKTKALRNMWKDNQHDMRPTLCSALWTAFNWIRSPEGYEYWKAIFDDLKKKENVQYTSKV